MAAPMISALTTLAPVLAPILAEALAKKAKLPDEMSATLIKAAEGLNERDLNKRDLDQMAAALQHADDQQIELNKMDAVSVRFWQAGWRPFIGWVCGAAFCWHFLFSPIMATGAALFGVQMPAISFEMETLNTTLFGLLGLGAMRSLEKIKQKAF